MDQIYILKAKPSFLRSILILSSHLYFNIDNRDVGLITGAAAGYLGSETGQTDVVFSGFSWSLQNKCWGSTFEQTNTKSFQ